MKIKQILQKKIDILGRKFPYPSYTYKAMGCSKKVVGIFLLVDWWISFSQTIKFIN